MKYTHRLADHNKVTQYKNSKGVLILRTISRHNQKNWHNRTTVLYTKYIPNTKNYFPPEPKN
jgi:hypothetical protein